jgi:hypothetical protein
VISFDPDSGVLLTDEGAAASLMPLDAEIRAVLAWQREQANGCR